MGTETRTGRTRSQPAAPSFPSRPAPWACQLGPHTQWTEGILAALVQARAPEFHPRSAALPPSHLGEHKLCSSCCLGQTPGVSPTPAILFPYPLHLICQQIPLAPPSQYDQNLTTFTTMLLPLLISR